MVYHKLGVPGSKSTYMLVHFVIVLQALSTQFCSAADLAGLSQIHEQAQRCHLAV